MKGATKEKKKRNNLKKTNNKNNRIFDYDQEVNQTKDKTRIKRTRKLGDNNKKKKKTELLSNRKAEKKELAKINKKKIKQLQKRTKEENIRRKKALKRENKQNTTNNRKVPKRKLTLKEIQQKKQNNRIVRTILIILIITMSILLLALSPVFYIKEVRIIGNEKLSKQEIVSLLNIGNETNIFKENDNNIREKLSGNPYIDTEKTTMHRILPEILEVKIVERTVEFLLEFGNSYAYIDKAGNILEIAVNSIEGKTKITGYNTPGDQIKPGNVLSSEDVDKIKDVSQIINISKNYELYDMITSINISNTNDYILYLQNEMKTVHLGECSFMETKMMYVKAILEKEKGNDGEIFVNVDLNKKNAYFKQNV